MKTRKSSAPSCLFYQEFEVLQKLSRGSYGNVSKVRRKKDNKILVCKVISYGRLSAKEKQLLVSEVNILRELRHPHIVRYYDRFVDKQSTKLYVIMECCDGGDLGRYIAKRRRENRYFQETKIWRALAQILLAFYECHNRRENGVLKPILHRDIKPGNILLDATGNLKIGDFGLAKELESGSKLANTYVGTPYYMAPEIIKEMPYNEKCDIWSIGCMIYEMAALRPPFEAKNVLALGKKIVAGRFERIPSRYSDDLQEVINEMLNIEPGLRPSASSLLQHSKITKYSSESHQIIVEYQNRAEISRKQKQLKQYALELEEREEGLRRKEVKLELKEKRLMRMLKILNAKVDSSETFHHNGKALATENTMPIIHGFPAYQKHLCLSTDSSATSTTCSTLTSLESSSATRVWNEEQEPKRTEIASFPTNMKRLFQV